MQAPARPGDASAAAADKSPLIVAEDIRKRFGQGEAATEVLRGASLHINAGELVALVGQSGSGKSTLLHILGGLDREFSGKVQVLGQELSALSDAALAHLRNRSIGFVFQAFHLLDHLSCLDNVLLPNSFAEAPLDKAAALERGREALARVGLSGREGARPSELSGGQRQRVAIARALFFRPRLLLCDEPTGNLDVHTGQHIIELFCTLNQAEGLTLVLVTHEPRVAEAAGRILRLQSGQAVAASLLDLSVGKEKDGAAGHDAVGASA
jgi:putative ABC transport system ATP-binding protein